MNDIETNNKSLVINYEQEFVESKTLGKTLFQTIGIMLALFFPMYLNLKNNLSILQYNLFMLVLWLMFVGFFGSCLGFLFRFNPKWVNKHIIAWKVSFLFTPIILLLIALVIIAVIFSQLEESLMIIQYVFIAIVISTILINLYPVGLLLIAKCNKNNNNDGT